MTACGSTDPVSTGGNTVDDDNNGSTRSDGGRDGGGKVDAGTGTGKADAGKPAQEYDSGFDQCADTRIDAEKKPGSVNIVFSIDTSGSMGQEGAEVQKNMNRFAQQIVSAGLMDYRVVVVSTRNFVDVPDPLNSDSAHFKYIDQDVDSFAALTELLRRLPDYKDFLIAGAQTNFIAVTDDNSSVPGALFVDQMKSQLGSDNFRVNAIASPPGEVPIQGIPFGGCNGPYGSASNQGIAYWDAAKLTNGLTFSICSGDWSMLFDTLAQSISESAAVPCSLELPAAPMGTTQLNYDMVNVVLGTTPLPRAADRDACGTKAGWYYDDANKPTGIELCPTSCDAASNGGSLQVALGCNTIFQ